MEWIGLDLVFIGVKIGNSRRRQAGRQAGIGVG